jgi:hypothetical protein
MNFKLRPVSAAFSIALSCLVLPAWADIAVRFIEGAPKDRFEITNRSTCAVTGADVTIDLKPSAAGLIFDITDQGAGVDVFQPFELVAGADALASHSQVKDGDREVTLTIRRLGAGEEIAFTIDVDDTLGPRGITVSGSEIQGALVRVDTSRTSQSGRFTTQGEARVKMPPCL